MQHGKSRCVIEKADQPEAREGQSGRDGMAQGSVVCAEQRAAQEG
jgi:hypothetical protein